MAPPGLRDSTAIEMGSGARPPVPYVIACRDQSWFIHFDGAVYGPYLTQREALLFAVDAANRLGEQGHITLVQITDEYGDTWPAWTFGQDPYPPRL